MSQSALTRYVNYIREINAFYAWLQSNELSPSAIILWHALMQADNRVEWDAVFPAKMSLLMSMTNLSRAQIYRAREELVGCERLICWRSNGRKSAKYKLVLFKGDPQG